MSVVITGNLVLAEADISATESRFGIHNILPEATVTATDDASGVPNLFDGNTYDAWTSTGAQTITVELGSAKKVDYFGIVGRGLAGCEISFEYKQGAGDWTSLVPAFMPAERRVLMVVFEPVTADAFRLNVTKASAYSFAALNIGLAISIPGGMRPGFAPPNLNEDVEYHTSRTVGGNIVGHSVLRAGATLRVKAEHLSEAWVREYWKPFQDEAHEKPFFFAWSTALFQYEVIYGVADKPPQAKYDTTIFMSINMTIRGIV